MFRQRAVNEIGNGEWSDITSIGQIALPTAPASISKILSMSSISSATLQWS